MKRLFFLLLFIFVSVFVFAQSFISNHISYLGKPVPNGFSRISETRYTNNDIILNVENGIVISSVLSEEYNNNNEADFYYVGYCNFFANNNWILFQRDLHCDVYKYSNIYVVCSKPQLGIDGVFVIMLSFYLEEYYDTLLHQRPLSRSAQAKAFALPNKK